MEKLQLDPKGMHLIDGTVDRRFDADTGLNLFRF